MHDPRLDSSQEQGFDPTLPIASATAPPSSWYTESDYFALEKRTVFTDHWQFVGHVDRVQRPGDYLTGSLLRRPYLVTRDTDGELRAFYNVCAHHGTKVANGSGCAEHFTCPYHGWEYHLSGGLKRAPHAGAVHEIRGGKVGLRPIPVRTFGPFVLLHFGANPSDLDAHFGQLEEELGWMGMANPTFVDRCEYHLDCNWKVFVDNYLDGGYHVPHMHADLSSRLEFSEYKSRLGDVYSVQTCPAKSDQRLGELAHYLWVYPNFMVNRYGSWLDTNLVLPVDERRCTVVFEYYHDGPIDIGVKEAALCDSAQVQAEDTEVAHMVQEGLESGVYRGLYASRYERPMYQFHQMLAEDFDSR